MDDVAMNSTCPLVLALCLATVPASGLCQQAPARKAAETRGGHQIVSRLPAGMLSQLNESLQQLARNVSPAVVQIVVSGLGPAEQGDRAYAASIVRQHAIGAGVLVDPGGYIMTNAHVVEGARRIRVTLSLPATTGADAFAAGRTRVVDAQLVGSDRQLDLALLKIEGTNLPALRFNLDRPPQPGELVFAIGSPVGLSNSVTMGVISSAWRQPDPDNPMVYLQTDAPINPGNSGGPLVDVSGAVVGLNTFVVNSGAGAEGLGFAIPARIVDFVYQSLRRHGRVDHVEIGVAGQTITPAMARGLALAQDWGVVIADVVPQGPADAAGIRPGDIILAVDGQPTPGLHDFTASLYLHRPGQVMEVVALRGDQRLSFEIAAYMAPGVDELANPAEVMTGLVEPLGILGLELDDRVRAMLPHLRSANGVIVLGRAGGFASIENDLRVGDVIHSLNRTPIASVAQLQAAVAQLKPGDFVALRIERFGRFQFLAFEMD
jgi:serine protease Do